MLRTRRKGVRKLPVVRPTDGGPGRRPGLVGLLGWVDQTVLWLMRTRGHFGPVERTMRALGAAGEWAAVWTVIGVAGAASGSGRRSRWLAAAALGPAAIGVNYAVKVGVGRNRPLIEEHPPLARAPSKLSFPSAHATSSVAAATALARVAPHRRVPLCALATAICLTRPYLGMHYPSDVVAGVALGALLGRAIPRLDEPGTEDRLIDGVARRARLGHATSDGGGHRTAGAVPGTAAGTPGAQ